MGDALLERRIAEISAYRDHWRGREEAMRREGRTSDADVAHHWVVNCERQLGKLRALAVAA